MKSIIIDVFINCCGSPGDEKVSCTCRYQKEFCCWLFCFFFIVWLFKKFLRWQSEWCYTNIWVKDNSEVQFSSVQPFSCVRLFVALWIAACQASLSITNSWSLPKLTPFESMMPSIHFILSRPLLLPPIPSSIRVFSNESTLHIR